MVSRGCFFRAGKFLKKKNFLNFYNQQLIRNIVRFISNSSRKNYCLNVSETNKDQNDASSSSNLQTSLGNKYKVFHEIDSQEIFDVDEEKKKINLQDLEKEFEPLDPYEGLNLKHGVDGVFTIENLVELLLKENAKKIFVATVPKHYAYVDYVVVVTCKTHRHMLAVANFIRKAYKILRYKNEKMPKIEGKNCKEWMAMDLGNIVVHIFSSEARVKYDLETLWSVGSEYDNITNETEEVVDVFEKYKSFIRELQPVQ